MMRAWILALFVSAIASGTGLADGKMQTYAGCRLIETDWADGDSFLVRFPDKTERTVRLYGVDCIEWHVTDPTDARRLRAQRRFFGISKHGGESSSSIKLAKQFGENAGRRIQTLLEEEFTVTTAFADARGDGKYKRIYAFVSMADGRDVGERLVEAGLARAFGVSRNRPDVMSSEEYKERLGDLELKAAKLGTGVWKFTDWESLPTERKEERDEEAELAKATDAKVELAARSVDLNKAPRDLLMNLPGIGETKANRIIEGRADGEYEKADDLARVPGIGQKTIDKMRDYLKQP